MCGDDRKIDSLTFARMHRETMTWERFSWTGEASGPAARSSSASCFDPANIRWYHFGGLGSWRHNDLWYLDCSTLAWHCLHDGVVSIAPPKRCKASLSLYEGRLLMFGGWAGGKGDAGKLNDLWSFDLAAKSWKLIDQAGSIPSTRSSHSTVVVGSSMLLFGGIGGCKFGDMYRLDLRTFVWTTLSGSNAGPPRSSYGALLHHEESQRLLLFGGLTCGQLNDVMEYQLKDGKAAKWQEVAAANSTAAPFKRGRHATALLDANLLVFGGTNLRIRDNALYTFDLKLRTWRPLPIGHPPPPMEGHQMVLAGHQLIVVHGWHEKGWSQMGYVLDVSTLFQDLSRVSMELVLEEKASSFDDGDDEELVE